jgi:hypothetical protein
MADFNEAQAFITVDYADVLFSLQRVQDEFVPFVKRFAKEIAETALETVGRLTPETASGRTKIKEMWMMSNTRAGTVERYIIANTYAKPEVVIWMEGGTKPHQIWPKYLWGMLHFVIDGKDIFCKHVHHPGTKAYRMVERTKVIARGLLDGYIAGTQKMLDDIWSKTK